MANKRHHNCQLEGYVGRVLIFIDLWACRLMYHWWLIFCCWFLMFFDFYSVSNTVTYLVYDAYDKYCMRFEV